MHAFLLRSIEASGNEKFDKKQMKDTRKYKKMACSIIYQMKRPLAL